MLSLGEREVEMHSLEDLIVYYNHCKKDDLYREVIAKILANLNKLENATIYEWADICYVSTTTISRLSRKLGYDSFIEFKTELMKSVERYSMVNQYVPTGERKNYGGGEEATFIGLLRRILDEFEAAVDYTKIDAYADLLERYKKIRIYSHGICFMEHHLQENLIMGGHDVDLISVAVAQYEDIKNLDEDTLVLFTCPLVHDGTMVGRVLKDIHAKGCKLFLITDSNYLFYLKYADYVYSFDGYLNMVDDLWFSLFYSVLSMAYRRKYVDEKNLTDSTI